MTGALVFTSIAPVTGQVTSRVSVGPGGVEGNAVSGYWEGPSISANGRYVAFTSWAADLVPGDTNGSKDVFVRDRQLGTTERVSVTSGGAQVQGAELARIFPDGRYVGFSSNDPSLTAGDTNGAFDAFIHDRQLHTTECVSLTSGGVPANGHSGSASTEGNVWTSADGRFVSFVSWANNLVPGDTNDWRDLFVRDRQLGTTERVSVSSSGTQGQPR